MYGRGTEFQKKLYNFRRFYQEGGTQALADLDGEIATFSKKYEQAKKRLTDFDVKRDNLYKQFQEVDAALRSVAKKLTQFDFKSIIALAESGGIQRYQALEQQIKEFKSKKDNLEENIDKLPFQQSSTLL